MMKKNGKRLSAIVLVVILLVFTACNGDGKGPLEEKVEVVKDTNEYVYIPEVFSLDGLMGVNSYAQTKDGIYLLAPYFDDETFTAGTQGYFVDETGKMSNMSLKSVNKSDILIDIESIGVLSDGSLVFIRSEEVLETGNRKIFFVHVNEATGEEITCIDITEKFQLPVVTAGISFRFLRIDKEDNIYLSEGQNMWVFDASGELVSKVATNPNSWILDVGVTREGQVLYGSWDDTARGICFYIVDKTGAVITKCKENIPEINGLASMSPGMYNGVLVNSLSGVVEYDTTTQTATTVLNWEESKISSDKIVAFSLLENGNILVIAENGKNIEGDSYEAILLKKTLAEEGIEQETEKEVVTLGVFFQDKLLTRQVNLFNLSQEEYKVEIIDYASDDVEAGRLRFSNELITGEGPDFFEISSLDLRQLAQEGFLEELSPYLDKDKELEKEDYFSSVVSSYAVNGGIYTIPSSFMVSGVVGSNKYLAEFGNGYGWSLEEILKLSKENPEKEIFSGSSKYFVLLNAIRYNYNQFVDAESGKCYFNSDNFYKLLEFANKFPDQYQAEARINIADKILNETAILEEVTLSSIQSYQMQEALFGEDFVVKGFPTEEGSGLTVLGDTMLVMNANSEHKDVAWEFMRSILTKEYYEKERVNGFPALIEAYDKKNESYMTPEYTKDENGNEIEISKGSITMENFSLDCEVSSKEEEQWIRDIIEHCDRAYFFHDQIETIIKEETAPYFAGEKSANEVANIIQNRVQMYVNENN